MLSSLVDGYLDIGMRSFLLKYVLIAENDLFVIEMIFDMGYIPLIISTDTPEIIIYGFTFALILDGLDCKLVEIEFIRRTNIKSVDVFAEL